MSTQEKPWWWPEPIDDAYFARIRKDYPDTADWGEDEILDHYNDGWEEFSDTWDHLGDARPEYAELAKAFLKLVEETGKSPSEFLDN